MARSSLLILLLLSTWTILVCLGGKVNLFRHLRHGGTGRNSDGRDHNHHKHSDEDGDNDKEQTATDYETESDHHHEDYDEDGDGDEEGTSDDNETMIDYYYRLLQQNGNVTTTSEQCDADTSCMDWGNWQSWSECHIAIPGSLAPLCHNALRTKRRFCAGTHICYEVNWQYCVHESSCSGKWSAWSILDDKCLEDCKNGWKRSRSCLIENGNVMPGMCLGSSKDEIQTENLPCNNSSCRNVTTEGGEEDFSNDFLLVLFIAGPLLLTIVCFIVSLLLCIRFTKTENCDSSTGHATSSSFLVSHWRLISERFRRTQTSLPRERNSSQVITEENIYNTIHIYENATLPTESVSCNSNSVESYYEPCSASTSHSYDFPSDGARERTVTELSETGYSAIGITGPYAQMQPLGFADVAKGREIKRAQSLDYVIFGSEPGRPRQAVGKPAYPPKPRGITQKLPSNRSAFSKSPSTNHRLTSGCVSSRISKKKSLKWANKKYMLSMHSNTMESDIQEDRYGYLVPNFSVNQTATQKRKCFVKSASLPMDTSTYVTMKNPLRSSKKTKSVK